MKSLCISILLLFVCPCFSQYNIDSLKTIAKTEKETAKNRIRALRLLTDLVKIDEIEVFAMQGLELLSAVDSVAYPYPDFIHDKISFLGNLAFFYKHNNAFKKAQAIDFYTLALAEMTKDKSLIAECHYSIGMNYYSQEERTNALGFLMKALPVFRETPHTEYLIPCLISMGVIYQDLKNYKRSVEFYNSAINTSIQTKNDAYLSFAYINLAVNYNYLKAYDSARVFSNRGIGYLLAKNDSSNLAWAYNVKAGIFYSLKQADSGVFYSLKALDISQQLKQLNEQKISSEKLFYYYKGKHDFEKALMYYLNYDRIADSIVNDENRLQLAKSQVEYEFSKKEEMLGLQAEKKEIQFEEETKRSRIIIGSVIAILGIALFFGYMVFKSLKLEKLAKATVLEQKEIIEEKQKEIIDSITYAKRIQEAILPPENYRKLYLPDSFVLYKPKDIVAGDFYWMENLNELLFIAVADCTGHGVPGAMVSVVCSNALNRSLLEFKITDPGKLLDKARELVLHTFSKSGDDIKDGMDISLCCLNTITNELNWAGANNPLWIIPASNSATLVQIKADKQPVGKHSEETPFTTHSIQLRKDDVFYIFSDGYADQFGGPKGKKYKSKQLEERLLSIHREPMDSQKAILNTTFEEWKGALEQVDDVCIIGIKI